MRLEKSISFRAIIQRVSYASQFETSFSITCLNFSSPNHLRIKNPFPFQASNIDSAAGVRCLVMVWGCQSGLAWALVLLQPPDGRCGEQRRTTDNLKLRFWLFAALIRGGGE